MSAPHSIQGAILLSGIWGLQFQIRLIQALINLGIWFVLILVLVGKHVCEMVVTTIRKHNEGPVQRVWSWVLYYTDVAWLKLWGLHV